MTRDLTITCHHCGDIITVPMPDNLLLIGDLVEAHGATHGLDWRISAASWVAGITYMQEALSLRHQLEDTE